MLTLLYNDDIYLSYDTDILLLSDIEQMTKEEFFKLLVDYKNVVVDSRLVDVICTISFMVSSLNINSLMTADTKINLFILMVDQVDVILTFCQYMTRVWFNNHFKIFDDKKLNNVLTTIIIFQHLNKHYRIDTICDVVSNSKIIPGKYNIEILISLLDHQTPVLQKLLQQRDFNIHLEYSSLKKLLS